MITYKNSIDGVRIIVKLDGRTVGHIKPEHAGDSYAFRYWPKGIASANAAGNVYPTVAAVKRSLELSFEG